MERKKSTAIAYADWVIKWRWPIMVLSVLFAVMAASGGKNLRFRNDYRVFFSKENPQLTDFEEIERVYAKSDNLLYVVAPKDGEVFTKDTLGAVEMLTEGAWQIPYSSRVDSIANFQHTRAEEDDLIVEDLIAESAEWDQATIDAAKATALAEPLLNGQLVNDRSRATGVNVTLNTPDTSFSERTEAVAAARELAAQVVAKYPNVDIHITGQAMLNNAFQEASMKDMSTLIPLMLVTIILVMAVLLRSVWGTVAAFFVIILSAATAMGLAGWLGFPMTPPLTSAPTVILTLGVADSVHILVLMFRGMRQGMSKREAITHSLRLNLQPVFLTSLTTAIGFLTMNFSDVPPLRQLGNTTALGVLAAYLNSVVFLPALMYVLPLRIKQRAESQTDAMSRFAEFVIARRVPLMWGSVAVLLALGSFLPRNELRDEFVKYFDESIEFRQATDFAIENLTGIYQAQYSLGSGEADGISDPAYLAKVDEFAEWWRAQEGVLHVNSLTDIMKRLNKNMHADNPDYYRLPDNRELAAQYLLLYEMSLPYGLDLNNQINVDKSATRLIATFDDISSIRMRQLVEEGEQWLRDNAPASMFSHGVGPAVMFAYISDRNIRGMLFGTVLAIILVSLALIVALRSLKFGLLSLIPNAAPALLGFGLWGVLVAQVNLGLSVVVAMTFGIVVDDTVHFLTKYLRARREDGLDPADAVRYAFKTVGSALVVTSLILVSGFSVLALSAFDLNAGMGRLTAIIIAFALIADFVFLPPVLMKLEEKDLKSAKGSLDEAPAAAG